MPSEQANTTPLYKQSTDPHHQQVLVRTSQQIPNPPRAVLEAVQQRHGTTARFYERLYITVPETKLCFTLRTPQYTPLVLPEGAEDGHQHPPSSSLAAVRLQAIYELSSDSSVWLLHQYYLNQDDLNRLPGGGVVLRPQELVLRKKLYHSAASSIQGAAFVYGSRSAFVRWGGRHANVPVYFCEKTHT